MNNTSADDWSNLFSAIKERAQTHITPAIKACETIAPPEKYGFSVQFNESAEYNRNLNRCVACDGELVSSDGMLVCKKCAVELPSREESVNIRDTNRNIDDNCVISCRIDDGYSKGYNYRVVQSGSTTDKYKNKKMYDDCKHLFHNKKDRQYISEDVLRDAVALFGQTRKSGRVFRNRHKLGVLGACIYNCSMKHNVTRTIKEIATACDIEEKYISNGERYLQQLNEKKIITLTTKVNPVSDYLDRYLAILKIDRKYKPFLVELVTRTEKKKLHLIYDSKINTRCIGTIYILVTRIPELSKRIKPADIANAADVGKTTFTKMYKMVNEYSEVFKKTFRRHRIPMPASWKKKKHINTTATTIDEPRT